jgi:NADP-dependent 3-hydroxy acid dehydrogenase YdfG
MSAVVIAAARPTLLRASRSWSSVLAATAAWRRGAELAVHDTLDRFGRLDVLVNNAGVILLNSALHTTVEEWDRMTKFGLNGFAESLRQELLSEHVRVSVVEPGTVDIELVNHLDEAIWSAARRQINAIEALCADDVADAIVYIVTRERWVAVNEILIRAGDQTW